MGHRSVFPCALCWRLHSLLRDFVIETVKIPSKPFIRSAPHVKEKVRMLTIIITHTYIIITIFL